MSEVIVEISLLRMYGRYSSECIFFMTKIHGEAGCCWNSIADIRSVHFTALALGLYRPIKMVALSKSAKCRMFDSSDVTVTIIKRLSES